MLNNRATSHFFNFRFLTSFKEISVFPLHFSELFLLSKIFGFSSVFCVLLLMSFLLVEENIRGISKTFSIRPTTPDSKNLEFFN